MSYYGTLRRMGFPEEQFTLQQLAPRRRRTGRVIGLTTAAVLLTAAITAAVMYATLGPGDSNTPAASSSPSSPVADGIARPDASCVRTDGTDHQDYWNGNGWWAGRIDGTAKEMPALSVLSLKLNGHQIGSVWICAPRSNG